MRPTCVLSSVSLEGPANLTPRAEEVAYLRSVRAIRERSALLTDRAVRGESAFFLVRPDRLDVVADRVALTLRTAYPRLDAPLHGRLRHFDAGGRARTLALDAELADMHPHDRARAKVDLIVPSVLLDAGAGPDWGYVEDGVRYTRSEGLAIATYHLFLSGALSASGRDLRSEADGLVSVSSELLGRTFQVSADNPLVGLDGRAGVLSSLGRALARRPDVFAGARPGGIVDWAKRRAVRGKIATAELLEAILHGLSDVWPGRVRLSGESLGDTWPHPALGDGAQSLVPFHKLSQWLTCSLVEPLLEAGVEVADLGALTPLAEYRNGGLLLDLGVLELRDPEAARQPHAIGSPLVVEWRALTVSLLDEVVPCVADQVGLSTSSIGGANLLAWATWAAGRELAAERRAGAGPPLPLVSDGTVF